MVDRKIAKNFFNLKEWYSITLNPIDQYQFVNKKDRYVKFKNMIYEDFIGVDHYLVIELSEPRGMQICKKLGPRLHVHGLIKFDKRSKLADFLLFKYYSLLRRMSVDIDTIADIKEWDKYIHKQHILPKDRVLTNYAEKPF